MSRIQIGDTISTDSGDKTVIDIDYANAGDYDNVVHFEDGTFVYETEIADGDIL